MHARVTAYKGHIVIELLTLVSIPNETSVSMDNPGNFGQVIMNTEKNLGVSQEAIELLKTVKSGPDGIGAVDWFATETAAGKGHAFSWIGGQYALVLAAEAVASRQWEMGKYVSIPNDVPQGAMEAIDG